MGRRSWGPDGPPEEAYERVTNPERYEPLHAAATKLLHRLEREFAIERLEGRDVDDEFGRNPSTRRLVRLVPDDSRAAPITVAFTDFPGVYVRFGSWLSEAFPACGCDACDESPDLLIEAMTEQVEAVVAGQFRESIRVPRIRGDARRKSEIGPREQSVPLWPGERVPRSRALEMTGGERSVTLEWVPWPRRDPNAAAL